MSTVDIAFFWDISEDVKNKKIINNNMGKISFFWLKLFLYISA